MPSLEFLPTREEGSACMYVERDSILKLDLGLFNVTNMQSDSGPDEVVRHKVDISDFNCALFRIQKHFKRVHHCGVRLDGQDESVDREAFAIFWFVTV